MRPITSKRSSEAVPISTLEHTMVSEPDVRKGIQFCELRLKPNSNEFDAFVQRSLDYKQNKISSEDYMRDLNRWFPVFKQFSSVSMDLSINFGESLRNDSKRFARSPDVGTQPPGGLATASFTPIRPAYTEELDHAIIAKSLAQNLTYADSHSVERKQLLPKISGKVGRLKTYWNKREEVLPFTFKKKFGFRSKFSKDVFFLECIDLTIQNLAKGKC